MANPGRTKDSLSRELSEARRTLSEALEATASSALGDPSDSDAHHSYVLEQTGANSPQHVIRRLPLENDVVYAESMK